MLTEIFIEALLVDEDLADEVWYSWNSGLVDDQTCAMAWWLIATSYEERPYHTD